jgi:hypothetical protein
MKTIALFTLLAATSANANNWPPVDPAPVNPIQATANAQSNSNAGAYSNQSLYNMPSTRAYGVSFSAPALAAALPGYLCPKGDSLSWSVGWGLVSYSVSTTRTEMECLDKLIAVMTAPQIVEHRLPVTAQIHPAPVAPTVAPIASSTRVCAPKAVRKAAKVCKR